MFNGLLLFRLGETFVNRHGTSTGEYGKVRKPTVSSRRNVRKRKNWHGGVLSCTGLPSCVIWRLKYQSV